nr:MAG TPA_asm: hypothetical protein [Caudoviricetes sp.]
MLITNMGQVLLIRRHTFSPFQLLSVPAPVCIL